MAHFFPEGDDIIDDPEYVLYQLHKRQREAARRARFSRARSDDPRKELAGFVEQQALVRLVRMGYRVSRTGYNEQFDLWCEGARVEVKGASWSGKRWQAAIRNHEADLLLFGCKFETDEVVFFIIPAEAYVHTSNIAVWTRDPADHTGQWLEYYRAWWWVDAVVSRLPAHRGWQPALFWEGG